MTGSNYSKMSPPWIIFFDNADTEGDFIRLRGRHKTTLYNGVKKVNFVGQKTDDGCHNVENSMSGFMWCAPSNVTINLKNASESKTRTFQGTNRVQSIDLADHSFNDTFAILEWIAPKIQDCLVPLWCILFDENEFGEHLRGRKKVIQFFDLNDLNLNLDNLDDNGFMNFRELGTDDNTSDCNDLFSGAIFFKPDDPNSPIPILFEDKALGGIGASGWNPIIGEEKGINIVDLRTTSLPGYDKASFNDEASSICWGQLNGSTWMQDSMNLIGEKTIKEICLLGTHDSGMSTLTHATAYSNACNTQTQAKNISGQLNYGSRYFDIRPVLRGSDLFTGHYSGMQNVAGIQGSTGEDIASIINEINQFTENKKELIILDLSHSVSNISQGTSFSASDWNYLLGELTSKIDCLFDNKKDSINSSLGNLLSTSSKVILYVSESLPEGVNDFSTVQRKDFWDLINDYANSNSASDMAKDQISKMNSNSDKYFLASWTLTQSSSQAATYILSSGEKDTTCIRDLAKKAHHNLLGLLANVKKDSYPKIILLDYLDSPSPLEIVKSINRKVLS